MKKLLFCLCWSLVSSISFSQEYTFTPVIDIEATEVKSQDITGTCWSYSASSFLESEILRINKKKIDISEMYNVRNTYPKKAWNYVMRQGKAQFSEGGLAHDVINSVKEFGLVPEYVFTGLSEGENRHNHAEMVAVLEAMLKTYIDNPAKKLSPKWKVAIESVLNVYLGERPTEFNYAGKQYTPQSFLKMTNLNMDDYVSITSFSHQPFYSSFVLNIPDNFSNGSFYNVPLDTFIGIIDNALEKGYTLSWDADVSEKTFSSKYGVAIIPENESDNTIGMTKSVKEKEVTQEYRQQEFENYHTTDDHLMHIVGTVKDQNGTKYYKVKNSWGGNSERVSNDGFVYVSETFVRLKSISVLLHKEALPKETAENLAL